MITKALVTAAIAGLAAVGAAAPAFADPASFADISCSCEVPVPQAQVPHGFVSPGNPLDQGIQQGLSDTNPGAIQP